MKNEIIYSVLDHKKASEVLSRGFHCITIDGKSIKYEEQFYEFIEKALLFPRPTKNNYNRFYDWITDLSWFPDSEGFVIIIKDFDSFCSSDTTFKAFLLNAFREFILPFWEDDVTRVVVGGKERPFYIVID